jgi:hypothetical protein
MGGLIIFTVFESLADTEQGDIGNAVKVSIEKPFVLSVLLKLYVVTGFVGSENVPIPELVHSDDDYVKQIVTSLPASEVGDLIMVTNKESLRTMPGLAVSITSKVKIADPLL